MPVSGIASRMSSMSDDVHSQRDGTTPIESYRQSRSVPCFLLSLSVSYAACSFSVWVLWSLDCIGLLSSLDQRLYGKYKTDKLFKSCVNTDVFRISVWMHQSIQSKYSNWYICPAYSSYNDRWSRVSGRRCTSLERLTVECAVCSITFSLLPYFETNTVHSFISNCRLLTV